MRKAKLGNLKALNIRKEMENFMETKLPCGSIAKREIFILDIFFERATRESSVPWICWQMYLKFSTCQSLIFSNCFSSLIPLAGTGKENPLWKICG